jgi:threonine synthase
MRFRSTRGASPPVGLSAVLTQGLAPDGGLYVPDEWPVFTTTHFAEANALADVAQRLIEPFAAGDALAPAIRDIVREAFGFPVPLVPVAEQGRLSVLELFHGPTAAFKDFGARFLAGCLSRLRAPGSRLLRILVATSGDTGGAVAAAFHERPGVEVVVLYPKGLVSPTQEHQLTCWGGNVTAYAVEGTFDDCQRLVKAAFADPDLRAACDLSSANSINLGRLLPQAAYYASTSLAVRAATGEAPSFIVPSGNLGNVLACVWARRLGLPIADIVLAHNANRTVPDFLESGDWRPRRSTATLASAMDVGDPSNMERLRDLHPAVEALREAVTAVSVDDAAIGARIRRDYDRYGQVWCPHTATAAEAYERLPALRRQRGRWVLVATAHPAKFREIVEPLIARPIPVPESLSRLFRRESRSTMLRPDPAALREALLA